jgi:isoleucyl-tRNA synthetase
VPVNDRPDIDRWILSDLQLLVKKAHESFRAFNVAAFCLEAEKFVDERLSNWYVRRNRRRFWKSEKGTDKLAAYQTLYVVLTTLTKLIAPIMPFMAETMWQNLRLESDPETVHLCDYPQVNESVVDYELSLVVHALLRLVSQGMSLRNQSKHKVRQPLATLIVQPRGPLERKALQQFSDQLREELNVKSLQIREPTPGSPDLFGWERKLNPKVIRQCVPERFQEVFEKLNAWQVTEQVNASGGPPDIIVHLPDTDIAMPFDAVLQWKFPEGWVGVALPGTGRIMLDTRITPELAQEGMAREVVRQVQESRKKAALQIEDRIVLYLGTESAELRQAIEEHRDYIAGETLTVRWSAEPLGEGAHEAKVKVDGQALTIQLRKA